MRDTGYNDFSMNAPLVTMTHVCRSWRNVLLSTTSFWKKVNFSVSKSQQAEGFLRRSGNQLLDIFHYLEDQDRVEPFLSTTLHNVSRLRRLKIGSSFPYLDGLLKNFSTPAPELKHLDITNDGAVGADRDVLLPNVFGGRLQKLENFFLYRLSTDLRDFNFPSLTRFIFTTRANTSVRDLTSFFERCPSLEFVQIRLSYQPQLPIPPPRKRVCLAALKELRFDRATCTSGLLITSSSRCAQR